MSQLFPELVEVLDNAPETRSYQEHWTEMIKNFSDSFSAETYVMKPASYNRSSPVVAALLCNDVELRYLAKEAGINMRVFDDIVAQVTAVMTKKAIQVPAGARISNVLVKLSTTPF
jgi:hypothetical protein